MRVFLVLLTGSLLLTTANVASGQVKLTHKKSPGTVCYVCEARGCACVSNQCVSCPGLTAKPGKNGAKKVMKK
jgi:hypothetical protein